MKNETQQFGLVPYSTTAAPAPRRGFIGRFLNGKSHEKTEMDKLHEEYALARRAIELDADLARHIRLASYFLEISKYEDRAVALISKQLKLDELCSQLDEIFEDDPMTGLVLKARIKEIYRGSKRGHGHNGNHRGRYPWNKR